MILVVGATGMVGAEICRLLAAAGKPVKALVRGTSNPARVATLERLGAVVVQGDLRDRRSLELACEGVEAVVTTASSMPLAYQLDENTPQVTDQDGGLSLVDVASDAGVRHLVYTSFPPMVGSFPLQDAKRAVEERLKNSGLAYTILQPTFFMEVWLSPAVGFDFPNHKAVIYGTGDNPISWISALDVARFAVASLDNRAAENATLELGGPEGITPAEVVSIFERAAGRPFDVTHVPTEALRAQFAAATDPMQKSFTGLMLNYASAKPIDMTAVLKAFPLKLRTVAEHARSMLIGQRVAY
jgi:NADH dehydrogenase